MLLSVRFRARLDDLPELGGVGLEDHADAVAAFAAGFLAALAAVRRRGFAAACSHAYHQGTCHQSSEQSFGFHVDTSFLSQCVCFVCSVLLCAHYNPAVLHCQPAICAAGKVANCKSGISRRKAGDMKIKVRKNSRKSCKIQTLPNYNRAIWRYSPKISPWIMRIKCRISCENRAEHMEKSPLLARRVRISCRQICA